MIHHATSAFWDCYQRLPSTVQQIADKNYECDINLDEIKNCFSMILDDCLYGAIRIFV